MTTSDNPILIGISGRSSISVQLAQTLLRSGFAVVESVDTLPQLTGAFSISRGEVEAPFIAFKEKQKAQWKREQRGRRST